MKLSVKIIPLLVLIFFCCSSNQEVETAINLTKNSAFEGVVLSLINKHRASKQLPELIVLDALKPYTDAHTAYMVKQQKISHDNLKTRAKKILTAVNGNQIAENVASGYSNPETLLKGWLSSSGHRKNIEGDFTHFNLSAKKTNNNQWYFTNIFIKKE